MLWRALDYCFAKIVSGKSNVETISEGKLQFESIDIETECQSITKYFGSHHCLPEEVKDPKVFTSMLELHQYTCVCIPALHSLCELYKLSGCLNDPNLAQLVEIATELALQGENANQTSASQGSKYSTKSQITVLLPGTQCLANRVTVCNHCQEQKHSPVLLPKWI